MDINMENMTHITNLVYHNPTHKNATQSLMIIEAKYEKFQIFAIVESWHQHLALSAKKRNFPIHVEFCSLFESDSSYFLKL